MADGDPARHGAPGVRAAAAPAPIRSSGWWRWLIVAAYLSGIFVLSAQSTLPTLPGAPSDKLEHFIAYAVLGALVVWAMVRGDWRRVTFRIVILATLCCTIYGWTDEFHQLFVPGRQYDLHDLLADGTGAFLAAAASWAWGIIARRGMQAHDV
jgi:VanZ family protein